MQRCVECDGDFSTCAASGETGVGVSNADFVLYVSAIEESICENNQNVLAFAGTCEMEQTLDRFANTCINHKCNLKIVFSSHCQFVVCNILL